MGERVSMSSCDIDSSSGAPGRVRAHVTSILTRDLSVFILGDMITTWICLAKGAIEINNGILPLLNPVFLLSNHPALWYLLMIAGFACIVWITQSLSQLSRRLEGPAYVGSLILIAPIMIEAKAVINNIGVMAFLL